MKNIGIIGLGLMGAALTERAIGGGFKVIGFDVEPGRRKLIERRGSQLEQSATGVAARCSELVFSLPTTAIVEKVIEGMGDSLRKGMLIIDTTTGDPDQTAALGARLNQRGISYVDATIAANSTQTRAGDALVLAGGAARAVYRTRPFLNCFAREVLHCGPCGSGARMKLVYNLVLGLNRAVLAEGLAFASAIGVETRTALKVLKSGFTYSRVMDIKGERMLKGDFAVEARLSQHLKDVRLIERIARKNGALTPFSAVHRKLLEGLEKAGDGELDNCAIIKAFLRSAA